MATTIITGGRGGAGKQEEVDTAQNTAGVSLGWAGEHPADAAGRLAAQGMLRVNQVHPLPN